MNETQMTTQELADFIFHHRLAKLATGEGGLVDPTPMTAMDKLMLEEWSLTEARKRKTPQAYLDVQARGTEELRQRVAKLQEEHAREIFLQGLELQAQLAPKVRKLLN